MAGPLKLSEMERRAVSGMDSLTREIQQRHALELANHAQDFRDMLKEIAEAHGLPADALSNGWGIDTGDWEIFQLEPDDDEDGITEAIE